MADPTRPRTLLLLVRHASTPETGTTLSGRKPGVSLSDEGRHQVEELERRLAALPVAAVYASPVERAMETARAIAAPHRLEVEVLEGVNETDYGGWTGRSLDELRSSELWEEAQARPSLVEFPDGESMGGMQRRAVAAVTEVAERHRGETVVLVSHADVIKALVAHFLGLDLDLFQRIVVAPASLTVVALTEAGPVLLRLNDTGDQAGVAVGGPESSDV